MANGTLPTLSTRIKITETSRVRGILKIAGWLYTAAKEVKVTIGGCGVGVN